MPDEDNLRTVQSTNWLRVNMNIRVARRLVKLGYVCNVCLRNDVLADDKSRPPPKKWPGNIVISVNSNNIFEGFQVILIGKYIWS